MAQMDTHWFSESGVIDIFIMLGPRPKDVFKQYAALTGSTELPPVSGAMLYFTSTCPLFKWWHAQERLIYLIKSRVENLFLFLIKSRVENLFLFYFFASLSNISLYSLLRLYFSFQLFAISYHQCRWNYNDQDDVKKYVFLYMYRYIKLQVNSDNIKNQIIKCQC